MCFNFKNKNENDAINKGINGSRIELEKIKKEPRKLRVKIKVTRKHVISIKLQLIRISKTKSEISCLILKRLESTIYLIKVSPFSS